MPTIGDTFEEIFPLPSPTRETKPIEPPEDTFEEIFPSSLPTPKTNPELFPDPNYDERKYRYVYDRFIDGKKVYIIETDYTSPNEKSDFEEKANADKVEIVNKLKKIKGIVQNEKIRDRKKKAKSEHKTEEGKAETSGTNSEVETYTDFRKVMAENAINELTAALKFDVVYITPEFYATNENALSVFQILQNSGVQVLSEAELDDLIYLKEH